MPRKKAEPKKPASDKATAADLMKMPSQQLVKAAAGDLRAARGDGDEVSKTLREAMAGHKTAGIHPAAIKHVESQLDKAKGSDRGLAAVATYFAHLDYYRDVLGLDELLKQQGQMFERVETGETVDDDVENGDSDLRPTVLKQAEAERKAGHPVDPLKH